MSIRNAGRTPLIVTRLNEFEARWERRRRRFRRFVIAPALLLGIAFVGPLAYVTALKFAAWSEPKTFPQPKDYFGAWCAAIVWQAAYTAFVGSWVWGEMTKRGRR